MLATVDGEEITRAELELEARERNLPIGEDPAVREALLQELVQRKLLVREARKQDLHRTPEYLLATRRLGELALAQQLLLPGAAQAASGGAIDKFIAANPQAFASRTLFTVDRLAVSAPVKPEVQRRLREAPSVAAMEKVLKDAGVESQRKKEVWDSAALTPAAYAALRQVGANERFVLALNGSTFAGTLLSVSAQPIAPDQRRALARGMMEQQRRQRATEQILQRVERDASVEYNPDYAPAGTGQ